MRLYWGPALRQQGKQAATLFQIQRLKQKSFKLQCKKRALILRKSAISKRMGLARLWADPIEVERASIKAFGNTSSPCLIGSVKSNIGHLEASAGMASLIKVLLQLQHREIAPSINCEDLNPKIDLENTSLSINRILCKNGAILRKKPFTQASVHLAPGAQMRI